MSRLLETSDRCIWGWHKDCPNCACDCHSPTPTEKVSELESQLAEARERILRIVTHLQEVEFGVNARYGFTCPACHGHKTENYGYVKRGPDRGHEEYCWLREAIDATMAEESSSPHCTQHKAFDYQCRNCWTASHAAIKASWNRRIPSEESSE